jgi:hypothetical protein
MIIFLVVHPTPWWKDLKIDLTYDGQSYQNLTFPIPFNHIVIIFTVFKNSLLIFLRILVNTHYLTARGKRLKKLFSIAQSQEMYAIKCIFKEAPFKMFIGLFMFGFLFSSFTLSVTESKVPIEFNPFVYFQNCVWFTFITLTTVGYGDLRPYSHLGYIMSVFCMVWGTLLTSCTLVILTNTLTLSSKEEVSLSSLKRMEKDIEYRHLCRHYVRVTIWRLWCNRRDSANRR